MIVLELLEKAFNLWCKFVDLITIEGEGEMMKWINAIWRISIVYFIAIVFKSLYKFMAN